MTSLLALILDNPLNFFGTMILMLWITICIITVLRVWQKSPTKVLNAFLRRKHE